MASSIITGVSSSFSLPGTYVTISSDNSFATTNTFNVVLMAVQATGAQATVAVPAIASDINTVTTQFGANSDMVNMYTRYRSVDPITQVYLLPVASTSASDITTALNGIGNLDVAYYISPFATEAAVLAFDAFLNTQWSYSVADYGVHQTAASDTFANLIALGGTVNSKYTDINVFAPGSTDSIAEQAAAAGAVIAVATQAGPANAILNKTLNVAPSGIVNAFNKSQRNSLFNAGLGTTKEDAAGNVYLEQPRMTYQTNGAGTADTSYRYVETMFTLRAVAQTVTNYFNDVYFSGQQGWSLVDDGNPLQGGSYQTCPSVITSNAKAIYQTMVDDGWCQDASTFNSNVAVQISNASTGTVAIYFPAIIAGQLRQINVALDFSV